MDIRLLKEEELWGDDALDIVKAYGVQTGLSDLAVALGGVAEWGW